jgi:cyclohexadienyl dehydratase
MISPLAARLRIRTRHLAVAVGLVLLGMPVASALSDEHFASDQAGIERLIGLIDQRLAMMPAVAAAKWARGAAITDAARERAVIEQAARLGRRLGLEEGGLDGLFALEVRLAREAEERLHARWHAQGFDYSGPLADLDASLRPELDRVTSAQLRALVLVRPVLQQPAFERRYADLAQAILPAERWSEADRRQLLGALAAVHAADSPALERIATAGVLRIGTTGDYAPFSVAGADGALSGADIELAKWLAARLGASPVFVRTSWPALLDDLRAQNFDLAIGGISITAQRAAVAAFSAPYAASGKTSIARCSAATRYRSLAAIDRSGVRVIVNPGGTNEQYVRAQLHRASIRVFADNRTIFDEIRAGRADVMITDDVEVALQTHRHPDLCATLRTPLTHADKAILLPRDPSFVDAVNRELSAAIAAGEPARLLQQAFAR